MSVLLDVVVFAVAQAHVLLSPYTKVEESFNLHAVHDILLRGVSPPDIVRSNYDHVVFPGPVPRSFVGALLLSAACKPLLLLQSYFSVTLSKSDLQVLVRLCLASVNALGLCLVRRAVSKRYGFGTGVFFALLSCSQFHVPFWLSRTVPNMFALFPVNLAYSYILNRMPNTSRPSPANLSKAIALLTFTVVVLRAEVALLLGPLVLQALLARWISFSAVVKTGLFASVLSLATTVLVDSYFWDVWPLWPEFTSMNFNVVEGKSANWGVSPYSTYWLNFVPKLMMMNSPLVVVGALTESRIRSLLLPPVIFISLISFLGHKEWRFVVYTVPLFNIAAARGAYVLTKQRTRTFFGRLSILFVIGSLVANVLMTSVITAISRQNYPGGVALARFNTLYAGKESVHVHIDNLAAQTGASLFLQEHSPPFLSNSDSSRWIYNKTEHLSASDIAASKHFTHAIAEDAENVFNSSSSWKKVDSISGFSSISIARRADGGGGLDAAGLWAKIPAVEIIYEDKLHIFERI